jgi:SAM-dependent methyltransferase
MVLAPGARSHVAMRAIDLLFPYLLDGPVADIGCGFASPLDELSCPTVGVDIDPRRASAYGRLRKAVCADAAALPFRDAHFVAAFSSGLLHHLDDDVARGAIGEMVRVVRPGGAVILFDGVRPRSPWKHPLASTIRALDFGRHMRTERGLTELLGGLAPWTYERVIYAWTGLEGVWCVHHRTT